MGAVQILTHSMVQSIEENSVRKGFDPRDFALVAEGGAGPLFAAQIALEVGTPCGARAAATRASPRRSGLLATDMVYEYVSTVYQRALDARRGRRSQRAFEELEEQARAQLEEDGIPADRMRDPARRRLPLPRPGLRAARRRRRRARSTTPGSRRSRADFHDIHEREYSRRFEDVRHRDPEHPRARDRAHAGARDAGGRARATTSPDDGAAPRGARRGSASAASSSRSPTRYYDRAALQGGQPARGPGDRQPVRLDHRDPARARRRRSTASGTS